MFMLNENDINRKENVRNRKFKWNLFRVLLAGAVVLCVFWLIFGFLSKPEDSRPQNYAELIEQCPVINENGVALMVDGTKIDEDIWGYYFMQNAREYCRNVECDIADMDWNKKIGEETILEHIKYNAIKDIVNSVALTTKARENGIQLTEEEMRIPTELDGKTKEELGVSDEKSIDFLRTNLILEKKIREIITMDVEKYMEGQKPEDYADNSSATIKMIEIHKDNDTLALQHVNDIFKRLKKGADFDKLWNEATAGFYRMDGEENFTEPDILWIYQDSIDKAFEKPVKTALNLKIDEVSDIIETETSYLIIKRVAGYTEVANMLSGDCEIKINKRIMDETVVK